MNSIAENQTAYPRGIMTNSKEWSRSLFNNRHYDALLGVCKGGCVICGSNDFLLFERVDELTPATSVADELFEHWFGGYENKKVAAVCLNCSLAARAGFWDTRVADAIFARQLDAKSIYKELPHYYGLLKGKLIVPARAKRGEYENVASRGSMRAKKCRRALLDLLGNKCSVCVQGADLHIDTVIPQFNCHGCGGKTTGSNMLRYWLHHLLENNLELLCHKHHMQKMVHERRSHGCLRRLFSGKSFIAWSGRNKRAATALSAQLSGGVPAPLPRPNPGDIIRCCVDGCGHLTQQMVLLADDANRRLLFACDGCADDFGRRYRVLGTVVDKDPAARRKSRECPYLPDCRNGSADAASKLKIGKSQFSNN